MTDLTLDRRTSTSVTKVSRLTGVARTVSVSIGELSIMLGNSDDENDSDNDDVQGGLVLLRMSGWSQELPQPRDPRDHVSGRGRVRGGDPHVSQLRHVSQYSGKLHMSLSRQEDLLYRYLGFP